jgi:hypothetical protein
LRSCLTNRSSYVCSKNVVNYEHFGDFGRGRCPLHDNVEDRHEQEVKKAADEAMGKVRTDNPDISDADLMIKVSDCVKQAEDARKGQAQAHANAFPYHMVDNQLQQRMGQIPPPPPPVVPGYRGVFPMQPPVAQYVPVYPYAVQPVPVFAQPVHHFQAPPHYGAVGLAPQPQQYVPSPVAHPSYLRIYIITITHVNLTVFSRLAGLGFQMMPMNPYHQPPLRPQMPPAAPWPELAAPNPFENAQAAQGQAQMHRRQYEQIFAQQRLGQLQAEQAQQQEGLQPYGLDEARNDVLRRLAQAREAALALQRRDWQ